MPVISRFLIIILVITGSPVFAEANEKGGTAITVMPFVALEGDKKAWLGKAISDMVARKLAEIGDFSVLERDRLQDFIKEMELQENGFTDQKSVAILANIAKLDQVIYGNYSIRGNIIETNLFVIDAAGQNIIQNSSAQGNKDDLFNIIDNLTEDFLKKKGTKLSEIESRKIKYRATDSITAFEHFYQGIDYSDNGRYEDAFGEFLASTEQDSDFLEGYLWTGRMLEYLGKTEQAIVTYTKIYEKAGDQIEGYDALFFAAKLSENANSDNATRYYEELVNLTPRVPHSIEAMYNIAALYESQRKYPEAYNSLKAINDFREEVSEPQQSLINLKARQSRFFNWDHALGLYKEAVTRMVNIYNLANNNSQPLPPPTGAFIINPDDPEIVENTYGKTKSLFYEDTKLSYWKEKFYAVVIPDGYVATGIKLNITGRVPSPNPNRSFAFRVYQYPLQKNFYNNWLGAVYGQTRQITSLQKEIAFHGNYQKILVFQFAESDSEIKNWSARLRLRKENEVNKETYENPNKEFYEGKEIARISLNEKSFQNVSEPQYEEQFISKKRITLLDNHNDGLSLIAVKGDLRTEQTDLWVADSRDGKNWSTMSKMKINSASHDFAPQLVRAEDGSIRLFWISNRRGLGWELWTSNLARDEKEWSDPTRITLEKFTRFSLSVEKDLVWNPLGYSVIQDHKGNWVIAFCSNASNGIYIISSADLMNWEQVSFIDKETRFYDPIITQDKTDIYWVGAIDEKAKFDLYKSVDSHKWKENRFELGSYSRHWSFSGNNNYAYHMQISSFPLYMFSEKNEKLALLFSDNVTGLQYARFNPDTQEPSPDLVKDITLEPFAATQWQNGKYLIAQWLGDEVIIREYNNFSSSDNKKNSTYDPIYKETEIDINSNKWERRIARTRFVLSDVTSVGAAKDGRVWWGIETGMMSSKNGDFFVSDVSMGFFYHHVTDIVPCGDNTYFASKSLDQPIIGFTSNKKPKYASERFNIPEVSGGISAIICGNSDELYISTFEGDIIGLKDKKTIFHNKLENTYGTTLVYDEKDKKLYIGTNLGELLEAENGKIGSAIFKTEFSINSIATTNSNVVWIATEGGGVYTINGEGKGMNYNPANSDFPYFAVGKIKYTKDGLWFMPSIYSISKGIGFFDGKKSELLNPPSHIIRDIVDFDIAPDGGIWIGSDLRGIYRLEK